jgi:hypothetical protein
MHVGAVAENIPAEIAIVWYGALVHAQFKQQHIIEHDIPPPIFKSPELAAACTEAFGPPMLQIEPQPAPMFVLQKLTAAKQHHWGVLVVQLV